MRKIEFQGKASIIKSVHGGWVERSGDLILPQSYMPYITYYKICWRDDNSCVFRGGAWLISIRTPLRPTLERDNWKSLNLISP